MTGTTNVSTPLQRTQYQKQVLTLWQDEEIVDPANGVSLNYRVELTQKHWRGEEVKFSKSWGWDQDKAQEQYDKFSRWVELGEGWRITDGSGAEPYQR